LTAGLCLFKLFLRFFSRNIRRPALLSALLSLLSAPDFAGIPE